MPFPQRHVEVEHVEGDERAAEHVEAGARELEGDELDPSAFVVGRSTHDRHGDPEDDPERASEDAIELRDPDDHDDADDHVDRQRAEQRVQRRYLYQKWWRSAARPAILTLVRDLVRQLGPRAPKEPKDRLIFALDVDHIDEAERLVKLLAPHVGMFKVGPRLFTSAGSLVLDLIHGMGSSVFLDLKFHDIPAQVAGAAREVARQRARMFTVHALGGPRMITAAVDELAQMTLIPGAPPPIV